MVAPFWLFHQNSRILNEDLHIQVVQQKNPSRNIGIDFYLRQKSETLYKEYSGFVFGGSFLKLFSCLFERREDAVQKFIIRLETVSFNIVASIFGAETSKHTKSWDWKTCVIVDHFSRISNPSAMVVNELFRYLSIKEKLSTGPST